MSGVYGDVLSAFPELMQEYTVYRMDPNIGGAGYGPRHDIRKITGIYRQVPGGALGIATDNRQPNEVGTLWCYDFVGNRLRQGDYIDLKNGRVYMLTKDNNYEVEAGHVRFAVCLVPGPNGTQKTNTKVDLVGDL